ncbi:serine/threonine-protein kinase [Scytonema sp. UIC 10036]|uniref:protein kinase domain-containing protein n=1 Tax=Scytonema sp. UIC 10036 TaxID=2304196 RepID=UPI00140F50DC
MILEEIPLGTLVNGCYRIQKVLGNGGFGRTYQAANVHQHNKLCVLKEFLPNGSNQGVLVKCKELFQREAETLYKLNHPQIPKFLATFEEDGRQFIVQEYVDGKNYWTLLQERQRFTETEVTQFLYAILPVIDYIHQQQIFHRDISPDNIILLKDKDLPVLIDFGVAKQTITLIHSTSVYGLSSSGGATLVGKVGYAPQEQIRGGQCSPSSDLYALGVTAIVLLTGKDPNSLYDNDNLEWQWQSYVNVSEQLAWVINKMLAHKPRERYQSASAVLADLQSSSTTTLLTASQLEGTPATTEISSSNNVVTEISIGVLKNSQPVNPPPIKRLPIYSLVGIAILLLGGVGVAVQSPQIAGVCGVLNNCAKDKEYETVYNTAVQQAATAQNFSVIAKSVSELEDSRVRLQNAINQLQTIPQNAKIYPKIQQALTNNKLQLAGIDKRLQEETKAQQLLDEGEKIATDATTKTKEAGYSVALLEEAKALWENAQKKMDAVPGNSVVAQKAATRSQEYKGKANNISARIDEIAAAQQREAQRQAKQRRQEQVLQVTENYPTSNNSQPSYVPKRRRIQQPVSQVTENTSNNSQQIYKLRRRIRPQPASQVTDRATRNNSQRTYKPERRRGSDSSAPLWGKPNSGSDGGSSDPLF